MKKPTTEEMRDFGLALVEAGRKLEREDAGRTGHDDEMGGRMIAAGAALINLTERDTPQRHMTATETLRVLAEGINRWAAFINGDIG